MFVIFIIITFVDLVTMQNFVPCLCAYTHICGFWTYHFSRTNNSTHTVFNSKFKNIMYDVTTVAIRICYIWGKCIFVLQMCWQFHVTLTVVLTVNPSTYVELPIFGILEWPWGYNCVISLSFLVPFGEVIETVTQNWCKAPQH